MLARLSCVGYFIYDTGHLLMYPIDRECLELVAHHSVVRENNLISCMLFV